MKSASIMADKRTKYTITWFIENYSYCWHKNEEELVSPEFTAEGLEGTVWKLKLYPRGCDEDDEGYISLFLKRVEMDKGPEEFPLECKLFFLSANGSTLVSKKFEYTFKRENEYGFFSFLEIDEVLLHRKTDYLPHDTLSVRCKMRKGEGEIERKTQISARTRIGIEKFSFLHVTENFTTLEPNEKKTVQIRSPANMKLALLSSLYITDGSCCDGKVIVEITPCNDNQILSIFRISLLDVYGRVIGHCEADNWLDDTKKDIRKQPLSVKLQTILNKKSDYLKDDKLTLLCECTFSTGVEFQKIESTAIEFSLVATSLQIKNIENEDKYDSRELLSPCSSALDDFTDLYNTQLLSDIKLETKMKSFSAHKNVLCARSSVFKAMLTNDMKEKNTDRIQIDDLEDDTVQQFLLFLYSDQLENLEWESAIKLYYAGDKYVIEKLKAMCASFLVKHVSTSNASELLLLADTHNDSDLKKAVEDFIFKHEDQVFGSQEWRNLMKTNPMLVSETMCLKYMRNM